jgi:hypothetical protein
MLSAVSPATHPPLRTSLASGPETTPLSLSLSVSLSVCLCLSLSLSFSLSASGPDALCWTDTQSPSSDSGRRSLLMWPSLSPSRKADQIGWAVLALILDCRLSCVVTRIGGERLTRLPPTDCQEINYPPLLSSCLTTNAASASCELRDD